jgi:hypothetical protein
LASFLGSANIRKLAKDHKGYGSAARGNGPPYFEKLRVANLIIPPPFLALNLIKKLFYFSMEAYIVVSQGYKDIWIRVCFETIDIVTFFFIAAQF